MNDFQDYYKGIVGLILIVGSIGLSIWLCLWIMLYGGLMQAVENFGVNNSATVWGIIRVIFTGTGMILAYLGVSVGAALLSK